jgi:hypothetical protein
MSEYADPVHVAASGIVVNPHGRTPGPSASIQPEACALVSVRVPPGMAAKQAQDPLIAHHAGRRPWHVGIGSQREVAGQPFPGSVAGPAAVAMAEAMPEVYHREVNLLGDGGSIPRCVFQETFPDAEIILLDAEEARCLMHVSNASVDPRDLQRRAGRGAGPLEGMASARGPVDAASAAARLDGEF